MLCSCRGVLVPKSANSRGGNAQWGKCGVFWVQDSTCYFYAQVKQKRVFKKLGKIADCFRISTKMNR